MGKNNKCIALDALLTKDQLSKDLDELQSITKVAEKYGMHYETIRKRVHQHSIPLPSKVIYTCDEDFFARDNEESFYLAGFIAADGCIVDHPTQQWHLAIALDEKDKDFLERIKNLLSPLLPIHSYTVHNSKRNAAWEDGTNYGFHLTSDKICHDLARFNVVPRKSLIYRFPKWLIHHPLVHHFMRGYNDGDGCIRIKNSYRSGKLDFILVGQPAFLEIYKGIIERECELDNPDKRIQLRSKPNGNVLGSLQYTGNRIVIKIADFLYKDATIYLPRKLEPVLVQKEKLRQLTINGDKYANLSCPLYPDNGGGFTAT